MIDIKASSQQLGDTRNGLLAMYDTVSYSFKKGKSFVVTVIKKNSCLQLTIFEDAQAGLMLMS